MVMAPRWAGQPNTFDSETNSKSNARPVITSGITIGAVIRKAKPVCPLNLPTRVSTKAARVPTTTDMLADMKAMVSDNTTPSIICLS